MKYLSGLLFVVSTSVAAAGLAQLFAPPKKTTPTVAPKPPTATVPVITQATKPVTPAPKPATTTEPATKSTTTATSTTKAATPSTTEKSSTEKTKEDKPCNSPTDSTCKK